MNKTLSVVMAVSNPITYDFPFVECVKSILSIADEIIIINGDKEFFWYEENNYSNRNNAEVDYLLSKFLVNSSDKFKVFHLPWQESFRKNMESIAKSAAISQASKDYVLLLDVDEVIHENDHDKIKQCLELGKDAYSFRTLHFYRDYNHYKIPNADNYWYNHRPKLFKNGLGIWDGYQSWVETNTVNYEVVPTLKTEYTADLITWDYKPVHSFSMKTSITIYHYGYVRDQDKMLVKSNNIEKRYHPEYNNKKEWEWDMNNCVKYTQSHPKVMEARIINHKNKYMEYYKD